MNSNGDVSVLTLPTGTGTVSHLLTTGGDTRLNINKLTNLNQYLVSPYPQDDIIRRGSCTCSNISSELMEIAESKRKQLLENTIDIDIDTDTDINDIQFTIAFNSILKRLSDYLGLSQLSDPADIILVPSGTDAEYLITIVAMVRQWNLSAGLESINGSILNCITASGEVGRNTARAAGGHTISSCTPMGSLNNGGSSNSGSNNNEEHSYISGFSGVSIEVVEFRLRSSIDGSVLGLELEESIANRIRSALGKCNDKDNDKGKGNHNVNVVVLHIVCCSKTGVVSPSLEFAARLRSEVGFDRLLVAVDCCQLRCHASYLQKCLEMGFMCMITGSKFFGGPPFR